MSSAKSITDPIYGTIELSDVEAKLVSTAAFQRLHNVRQLGLGHLVFPSAAYSRFSHSVGALFNARRIMEAINRNRNRAEFSSEDMQLFQIAALFHDLGHYPFSHTTEHAVEDYYSNNLFADAGSSGQTSFTRSAYDHEKLGEKILELDPEINSVLEAHDISVSHIRDKFLDLGKKTIISSDLDCDRMDYLRRTAHHSGAPYGAVDVDFIISQATLDKDKRFCFGYKSFRAVDHLLVSRFFDFSQIPFHKTVAALEWSLEEAVRACLERGLLAYSQDELKAAIQAREWWRQDEAHLLELFKNLLPEARCSDEILADHISAVLFRKSAKQILLDESFTPPGSGSAAPSKEKCQRVYDELAKSGIVDPRRLYLWWPRFRYAKNSPVAGRAYKDLSEEEQFELIHILPRARRKSVPLVSVESSLAFQLAPITYDIARVYYLPAQSDQSSVVESLRQRADAIS